MDGDEKIQQSVLHLLVDMVKMFSYVFLPTDIVFRGHPFDILEIGMRWDHWSNQESIYHQDMRNLVDLLSHLLHIPVHQS